MRRIAAVLVLATMVALGGCATPPAGVTPPTVGPPSSAPPVDPTSAEYAGIGLVGLWRVSGATGEQPATWLRLAGDEVTLWRACGTLSGAWAADDRSFVALIDGGDMDCASGADFANVPWLLAATGFRPVGAGWELTDSAGAVVAALAVDGAPDPSDTIDPSYARPPVVDDRTRALFHHTASLPDGLSPADASSLLGRWVPTSGPYSTDPHLEFAADGWTASDGCNGMGGRWTVPGDDGRILSLGGGMTLIGCEGADVPMWAAQARLAGLDGDELVLLDQDATELGRLVRS